MNPRAVLRIGSVLVVAIFAALLLRGLFMASTAEPPPPEMASIQVASGSLPLGLLLKAEDLTWKQVPVDSVQPGEIRKGTPMAAKLPGAVLRRPLEDGAPVHENDVVYPDSPGFLAAALKPGMRAVSVAIDDVTGNAGLIQPGDYVDLVLTQQLQTDDTPNGRRVASETVLSDMRVIAVGQALRIPENDGKSQGGSRASARTVTLEVQPRDAEKVAVVTRLGQLSLALRSLATTRPEDGAAAPEEAAEVTPTWGKDVSAVIRMTTEEKPRPKAHAASSAPPVAAKVQVFRGTTREAEAMATQASAPAPMGLAQ